MSIKKVAIYQPATPYEFLLVETDGGSFALHFNNRTKGGGVNVCEYIPPRKGTDTIIYSRKRFLKTGRVA